LGDLVSDLLRWELGVEDVLLEKGILAVHVSAVEKSVAVDDLIPIVLLHVACVVIFFTFDIVLVTLDIFARNLASGGKGLAGCTIGLET